MVSVWLSRNLGNSFDLCGCIYVQYCENSPGLHYSPLVRLTFFNIHHESQWKVKGTLKHAKIQWRLTNHSKSFEITISIQGMVSPLLTCVLLVQVHILWYYTPTQLRMYTPTQLHSFVHTYVHVLKVVCEHIRACTPVHGSRTPTCSMRCDTRSRRRAC